MARQNSIDSVSALIKMLSLTHRPESMSEIGHPMKERLELAETNLTANIGRVCQEHRQYAWGYPHWHWVFSWLLLLLSEGLSPLWPQD